LTGTDVFTIGVIDDTPMVSGEGSIQSVNEANLDDFDAATGFGSTGTNSDAQGDGPPVQVTGSIASFISIGADQPGSYGFAAGAVATLQALGLSSQSHALSYQVSGDTLTAFVNIGGTPGFDAGTDRPVFTLQVDASTGNYTFTLIDQLDHVAAN